MKNALYIHIIWAVVAGIAFVVGAKNFTGAASTDSEDADSRVGARYSERYQRAGHGAPGARATSRNHSAAGAGRQAGKTKLSDAGIRSLGQLLKTSNDPIERQIAFAKLLESMTAENAMFLREQIAHLPDDSDEWREFNYAWGALAGESAVTFGETSEKRDHAALLSGWASADPQAVAQWFDQLPDDRKNSNRLKWAAVYGMSHNDPILATNFILDQSGTNDRDAAKMINVVAASFLRSSSTEDVARWSENLPEGRVRDAAVSRVAREFADEDPAKAVAWLTTLPQSDGQNQGMDSVFSRWARQDAEAAASQLNEMAESPMRDSAVKGFSDRLVRQDPAAAIQWASTISDTTRRTKALVDYGRRFMRNDPDSAASWLVDSGLDEASQKRIQSARKRQ
ncbi:hypothetical protein JIN77_09745 [Verrucomicrobiaceae bacterium R5-34]|nr:hypothetical protein [Verrucomicrobiaceae bacterium R5-34]